MVERKIDSLIEDRLSKDSHNGILTPVYEKKKKRMKDNQFHVYITDLDLVVKTRYSTVKPYLRIYLQLFYLLNSETVAHYGTDAT